MSTVLKSADFKEDDRVRHQSIGLGTVEWVRDGRVQILFDDLSPRGREQRGLYDNKWFAHVGLIEKLSEERT